MSDLNTKGGKGEDGSAGRGKQAKNPWEQKLIQSLSDGWKMCCHSYRHELQLDSELAIITQCWEAAV
ncbi:hypothetical protein Y1Q_0001040 [Alligator mississippiensis]|uniref:Uncharacterized protein n=1 Tax=Alligator mississippiensis TaxID=8496 RepID=A0A151NEE8_ALLMI|nr:hypothetical protein Y1Q_0001040 [Alligator mississippiensis]